MIKQCWWAATDRGAPCFCIRGLCAVIYDNCFDGGERGAFDVRAWLRALKRSEYINGQAMPLFICQSALAWHMEHICDGMMNTAAGDEVCSM